MIPLKLKVEGLYSYQEQTEIDFTRLTAAGIFGIFGPVGSGKSALLEAITFALYGDTERLKPGGRAYNMMNLQSSELLIDFEFRTGINQKFRFAVRGKRSKKRFEEVNTFERKAYREENGAWVPLDHTNAEKVLGLSYKNFQRTIIIPQGTFQEFLSLSGTERSRMMKELFGLHRFELSKKTGALSQKVEIELGTLEGRLQEIGNVDETILAETEEKIPILKSEIARLDEENQKLSEQKAKLESKRDLHKRLTHAELDLSKLLGEREAWEIKKSDIGKYEKAYFRYSNPLRNYTQTELRLKEKDAESSALKSILEEKKKALLIKEQTFSLLQDEWKKKEETNNKISLLGETAKMIAELNKEKEFASTYAIKSQFLSSQQKERKELETRIEKQKDELQGIKKGIPDLIHMQAILEWFGRRKQLESQMQDHKNLRQKAEADYTQVQTQSSAFLIDAFAQVLKQDESIPHGIEPALFITNKMKAAEEFIAAQRHEFLVLNTRKELSVYSDALVEGSPCPICGSIHHPDKFSEQGISLAHGKIADLIQRAESKLQKWREIHTENARFEESVKAIQKMMLARLHEEKLVADQMKEHLRNFIWTDYSVEDEQKLRTLIKDAQAMKIELESKETSLDKLTDQLRMTVATERAKEMEVNDASLEWNGSKIRLESIQKNMGTNPPEEWLIEPAAQLLNRAAALKNELATLEASYGEADLKVQKLRKESQDAEALSLASEKVREDAKNEFITCQQECKAMLEQDQISLEEVKKLLATPLDIEAAKANINAFFTSLQLTQSRVNELKVEVTGKPFDEKEWDMILISIEEKKLALSQSQEQVGILSERLREFNQKLVLKKELSGKLESIKLRKESLKTLLKLFYGSGFVNFVSSIYLRELVNRANVRFSALTRNALSMELADDNEFLVRDYLNGGQTRNIKTLSGGQTFQAALSLALALSDSVVSLQKNKENFFFMDEGFGTLDKNALHDVFDSVLALRKEGRVVGIISHVEELQQEIPYYIKVNNDPERGSLLQFSWELE